MALTPEEEQRLREEIRKSLEEEERRKAGETSQLERERERIRREEEEKFYRARGLVRYEDSWGRVEWITPEEAEPRRRRRKYRRKRSTIPRVTSKLRKWKLDLILGSIVAVFLVFLYLMISGRVEITPGIEISRGTILVTSSEPGAVVYIDGKPTKYITPCAVSNLLRGPHTVTISKPGYFPSPLSRSVEVDPKRKLRVDFFLSPISRVGSVLVSANIEGADILLDGAPTGFKTDFELDNIPVGVHTISVSKPGYSVSPPSRRIEVVENRTTKASFFLEERVEQRYGTIAVSSNVKGAAIFLDGKATGQTTDATLRNIPVGQHIVSLSKPGYVCLPSSLKVEVSWDKLVMVSFELIRQFGRIKVQTSPVQGPIYIDGQLKGIGRYSGKHEVGEHVISFGEVKGYLPPVQREITLTPNGISLTATYIKSQIFSAQIDVSGRIAEENCKEVVQGYLLLNEGEPVVDEKNGPPIEYSPKYGFYYWKLGQFFPGTKEKAGYHFVEIVFQFDQEADSRAEYFLRLWGYATNENIGLYTRNITRIDIEVNGKPLVTGYPPGFNVDVDKTLGFEQWRISDRLIVGENRVMVALSPESECYFWLRKLEVVRR